MHTTRKRRGDNNGTRRAPRVVFDAAAACLLGLVIGFLPAMAIAQESEPELGAAAGRASAKLLSIKQKIRDRHAEALENRRATRQRKRELAEEKNAVDRALKQYRRLIEERQAKLAELREKIAKADSRRQEIEVSGKGFRDKLIAHLAKVEKRVEAGIPWKIEERKASIKQARESIESDSTALSAVISAAARIQSEEEALGRSVETGNIELDLPSGKLAVNAFHLGLLAVVYASDDGQVVGYAQAGEQAEDGIQSEAGSADAARGYLIAVDILRRRRTPTVVDLTLPTLPLAKTPSRHAKED